MTVTLGTFSTNALTAQPFAYEGNASDGLTSRTFRIAGLLTSAQWQALISEYNTWRNARINDQDTLLSGTVGTTVSLSITSSNGISVSSLACWFSEAPQGEQVGAFISATAVLVDAAQALAVLLKERDRQKQRELAETQEAVDCALITARLERQRDETDCELTALQAGLADDQAVQAVTREGIEKTARLAALVTHGSDIANLDAQIELQNKTDQLGAATIYGQDQAELDLQLETAQVQARLAAYPTYGEALKAAGYDQELAETTADLAALGSRLDDLKDSRSLKSLHEKYISEDLPDLGTFQGITLTAPSETRYSNTNIEFTAGGNVMVSGQMQALAAHDLQGYVTPAGAGSLLSWYDAQVAAGSGWFPTSPPRFTAEHALVDGVKQVRYTVTMSVVQLPS